MDLIERIRESAYSLWEGNGRPEGTQDDDWLEAEQQFNQGLGRAPTSSDPAVEGEGSYTGAKTYDDATTAFAHSDKVEPAAQSAAAALDDPEQATDMARAAAVGKSHSHGEDPLLKVKK
jgi:hypothetical protein